MPEYEHARSYFVEARSDSHGTPSVLFNCGLGPISHVEVYSYMAGSENLRVVFRGEGPESTREYKLEKLRAKTFLRNLHGKGMWEPEAETARSIGR